MSQNSEADRVRQAVYDEWHRTGVWPNDADTRLDAAARLSAPVRCPCTYVMGSVTKFHRMRGVARSNGNTDWSCSCGGDWSATETLDEQFAARFGSRIGYRPRTTPTRKPTPVEVSFKKHVTQNCQVCGGTGEIK